MTRVINLRYEPYDVYIGRNGKGKGDCNCKPNSCHGDIIKEYLDSI